jgi:hypothetical protein
MKPMNATRRTPSRRRQIMPAAGVVARAPQPGSRRSLGRRWLAAGAAAVVIAVIAGCSLRLLTGQGHPPIVTTPNDYSATNDAPAFQTMLSAGDGTLLVDVGKTYWCTASSCVGGPSLAAWTGSLFYSVAGGVLPDGRPVLAGLTQVHGDTLRLGLLGCSRRTCTAAGGGAFTAPDFNPATVLNTVYAASENGAGFAVAFGNGVTAGESLYVVVCDSARCEHPRATRLRGVFNGFALGPGVSNIAVAAAPDGGFAAAVADPRQNQIDVYECPEEPCRAVARRLIAVPAGGPTAIIAITVASSGRTLLAYDSGHDLGDGSQVVLAGAAPGGLFSRLATVNAPVAPVNPDNFPDAKPAPAPAIVFAGRDLMVLSEDPSGHAVTLTTCVAASCGHTTEVRQVARPGNPIVALGIGVPAGNLRVFWSTQDTGFLGAISYSGHLWIGNLQYQ